MQSLANLIQVSYDRVQRRAGDLGEGAGGGGGGPGVGRHCGGVEANTEETTEKRRSDTQTRLKGICFAYHLNEIAPKTGFTSHFRGDGRRDKEV